MRTALEEINYRLGFVKGSSEIRPNEKLSNYDKAFRYRTLGWQYYAIYLYEVTLGINKSPEDWLRKMEEMSELAALAFEPDKVLGLELTFLAKVLLSEYITDIARQIVTLNKASLNGKSNPLFSVLSCLRLGENHVPYTDFFRKKESEKHNLVLAGSSEAIAYLINRDEDNLAHTLNSMLLVHHKEANNRHSYIYKTYHSFLSLAPYLIVELAEYLGMEIQSKIFENIQSLKLGLSFPMEFPDLPKNYKMPIEINYLTAKTNLANAE